MKNYKEFINEVLAEESGAEMGARLSGEMEKLFPKWTNTSTTSSQAMSYKSNLLKYQDLSEQKFYRGHAKGANPNKPNHKGITWISPDKELASEYGEEVSEMKFNPKSHKIADIGEINRTGTVKDILDAVKKTKSKKAQELYDAAVYHFGGGSATNALPKFLHKVGSEKVIAYLKEMGITALLAKEDGVITYGILS